MEPLNSTSPTPAIQQSDITMDSTDMEMGPATDTVISMDSSDTHKTETRTMSVPTDAYHALLVLMTHDPQLWDSLPVSERRAFFLFAISAGIIQYGSVICLLVDTCITDISAWSIFTDGDKTELDNVQQRAIQVTIIVKIFAIFMLSCYVLRDYVCCWRVPILCQHLDEFREWEKFVYFVLYVNYGLLFLSSILAFISIMQSDNGFDAFSNAVSVMFILEVDDWMYQICSLHPKLKDEMFEVEYDPNRWVDNIEEIDKPAKMQRITAQNLFFVFTSMTCYFAAFGSLLGAFIFGYQAAYIRSLIFFILGVAIYILYLYNRRRGKKEK